MPSSTSDSPCPFCDLDANRVRAENAAAVAIADAFPIADGHMLAVPKRHVASIFDLTDDERHFSDWWPTFDAACWQNCTLTASTSASTTASTTGRPLGKP